MEDFSTLLGEIRRRLRVSERVALATVVGTKGSTPRKSGARMLIDPLGPAFGTVGGGCGEAEIFSRAQRVLQTGSPALVEVNLLEEEGWESPSICGGILEVWVERIDRGLHAQFFELAEQTLAAGTTAFAATILEGRGVPASFIGRRALFATTRRSAVEPAACEVVRSLGDVALDRELLDALARVDASMPGLTTTVEISPDLRVAVECLARSPELVIVGAGHVGAALSRIAAEAGFEVVIFDDRPEFANPSRLPDALRIRVGDPRESLRELSPHGDRYLVLVTRGHRLDASCLEVAAAIPATYRGMIGSRRRVRRIRDELEARGVPGEVLESLHAPIGMDIGAETPGEIAVAILAEMIAVRHAGRRRPVAR